MDRSTLSLILLVVSACNLDSQAHYQDFLDKVNATSTGGVEDDLDAVSTGVEPFNTVTSASPDDPPGDDAQPNSDNGPQILSFSATPDSLAEAGPVTISIEHTPDVARVLLFDDYGGETKLLAELEPDYLLVQGDTTSAMIGALAAFHRRVPVGHVEAGLRTGDMWSPWPEEGNRRMVGALADLHFAPTEGSRANLLREGVPAARVLVTGNTVVDALLQELERQREPGLRADLDRRIAGALGDGWRERPYVLVTGHRRESFGRGFDEICAALRELSERFPTHDFVYPVHLNPNVQAPVRAALEGRANVRLVAPQAYREFVALMEGAALVLTDSGGIQEEAPSLGKPVLVMRDTTERPEGVEAGTVRLVGPHRGRIVDAVTELLADPAAHARMATAANPYGDGRASARIAAALADRLAGRRAA